MIKLDRNSIWPLVKDCIMILIGLVFYAVGFCGFVLPEQVVIGGVPGVSTILYISLGIPVAISLYSINILLLVIASRTVGWEFVIKTVFGSTFLSLFIGIAQPIFEAHPIFLEDTLLNCIIGAIMCGIGIGMGLAHNGSSGGTDIIAAMVSKYKQVSVGRMILYVDMCVITSSYFVHHSIDKMVYGYVVLVFLSFVADMIVNTNKQAVQFTIFSKKWDDIATIVNTEMHRGCTILDGTGWYTKQEVKMLIIFCRKIEALQIYRIVKSVDPKAFISQANVNTVYGEGFEENKVKARSRIEKQDELHEEEAQAEKTC